MKKLWALLLALALVCLCALPAFAASNDFVLEKGATTLFENETLQLVLLRQNGTENLDVTWTSNDQNVATVDENGLVTGRSKGSVTITASATDGNRRYRAQVSLRVYRAVTALEVDERRLTVLTEDDPTLAGLLTMTTAEPAAEGDVPQPGLPVLVLSAGHGVSISATLTPKDASNRRYTLESSDPNIVRVNDTNANARNPGECILTVASQSNPEVAVQYHVLVVRNVTSVRLSCDNRTIGVGVTTQVNVALKPDDASIKEVTWESSNTAVATVDENGLVTGVSRGSATIKATSKDGSNHYGTIGVTVRQQPTSIQLDSAAATVAMGSHIRFKATVLPTNANDKSLTWSSSDESIAKVNSSGYITPVKRGECTITAASAIDSSVWGSATLVVTQPVTKVSFTDKNVSVNVDETVSLHWVTEPADANDPSVTFSSNNEKIATVDADGTVHGIKRGEATITVKSADGSNRRATIRVNVLQPVHGVHMREDLYYVDVDEGQTIVAVMEPEDASNTNMTWTSSDTSIATVRGTRNRPTVTGHRWGEAVITGVTEDGGYTTSTTVKVGNYDKALRIDDFYLQDNQIKIGVTNVSNMNITRFYFTVEVFDNQDQPLAVNANGTNVFEGSYRYTIGEMETTTHGRFTFTDFVQPTQPIGRMVLTLTSYRTDEDFRRTFREGKQPVAEFRSPTWAPLQTEEPVQEN